MKILMLSAALVVTSFTASDAQMMAAGNSPATADAVSPAVDWYPCAGTFTVSSNDRKYTFSGLQMRKIDGLSFEIKGSSNDPSVSNMLLHIRTLNPDQILRPGMIYVSEGSLEAGETFNISLHNDPAAPLLISTNTGCTLKIGSARGGSVQGEAAGKMTTANGSVHPFTAQFNIIDARYGR